MALDYKTDIEILKEIGARLRAYRLQLNLSQAQLATQAGVNRTTIRDVEAGKDWQFSTFVKLLRALGRLENLNVLLPAPPVSPIQLLKHQGRPRLRARKRIHG